MLQTAYFQMAGAGKGRNQDALFNGFEVRQVKLHKTRLADYSDGLLRLAVSDGVFNSPAPHLASRFWMEQFAQSQDSGKAFLQRHYSRFCASLADMHFGSACTFVSAEIGADGVGRLCHCGDSRAYRIDVAGNWTLLTQDHSVLREMIERGEAEAGRAYAGIYDALASCLIADSGEDFQADSCGVRLTAGETLLLCSDGLSDALNHQQLEALWRQHETLVDKLEALRRMVKRVPFYDDCSVVCAYFPAS